VIFDEDESGAWWVTGYVNVCDGQNVDCLLGPFDTREEAVRAADRAKYGILHLEDQ
jgi:hypothetical protein